VLATSVLFFLGVAFGYLLIAPLSVQFLGNYSVSEQVENIIRLNSFISIVTMTSLSGGIVFQLPIVIYFLAELGLVTPQVLRKYRRHAIVGVLIISAVITPPDISSQILVSLPLIFLYEVSIYIAKIVTLRKERRAKSPA
ncbi:MAG TPA: twin-arginine translocase subunit TatC, partial [Cryomorphaceae bacterium]|nr:twin-arginine translocase subunit TatC [Cryomorphaceae bacterium]